eukprot:Phypoly_transcript_20279.p1 GENE.Phypoly_transcript_20279~~Phypoly_transcript_20279.p1  ORF type:complete len:112 (+),score=18.55 Phypoly_transcript_20279:41-337(+)
MTREKEITFYAKGDPTEKLKFPREFVIKELFNLFPYIGLDKNKFSFISDNYSLNDSGRKNFFERVAKLMKFDSMCVENWYSISRQDIMKVKEEKSAIT